MVVLSDSILKIFNHNFELTNCTKIKLTWFYR